MWWITLVRKEVAQVPLVNASLLSNLCEYRHIIFLKTRFFRLHLCCRHYWPIFDHFDLMGPKAIEFGEIMQNNGHYAIQGHLFWCKIPLVINTNLHPILHYFQVTADYWSNLHFQQGGYLSLTHLFQVNP